MQYRRLGKTNLMVSVIAFGGMQIPHVSEEQAIATIRRAIELGVNFIETGPLYGDSEVKIGKAIQGLRDKVYLSTKSHISQDPTADDVRRRIDESLKRLQTDRVECYCMWSVSDQDHFDRVMAKGGPLEGARRAQSEGLFDHLGITSHAPLELVEKIIRCGEFETITLPYGPIERKYLPMIKLAYEHDMGIEIMRPLAGGLAAMPSGKLGFLLKGKAKTSAQAALRFLVAHKEISTILSGMKSVEQAEENCAVGDFAGEVSEAELEEMYAEFKKLGEEFCTACGYCQPCPAEIKIPDIFQAMNYYLLYGLEDWARNRYRAQKATIKDCTDCGECESKCPNKLNIRERLREADKLFGE